MPHGWNVVLPGQVCGGAGGKTRSLWGAGGFGCSAEPSVGHSPRAQQNTAGKGKRCFSRPPGTAQPFPRNTLLNSLQKNRSKESELPHPSQQIKNYTQPGLTPCSAPCPSHSRGPSYSRCALAPQEEARGGSFWDPAMLQALKGHTKPPQTTTHWPHSPPHPFLQCGAEEEPNVPQATGSQQQVLPSLPSQLRGFRKAPRPLPPPQPPPNPARL